MPLFSVNIPELDELSAEESQTLFNRLTSDPAYIALISLRNLRAWIAIGICGVILAVNYAVSSLGPTDVQKTMVFWVSLIVMFGWSAWAAIDYRRRLFRELPQIVRSHLSEILKSREKRTKLAIPPGKTPLIVSILQVAPGTEKDMRYQLYCIANGFEMRLNDEWNAELVLLAPPGLLSAVTQDTAVTGTDTKIVAAGVTDVPMVDGKPDLREIEDEKNNWLLVGGPGCKDSEHEMRAKIRAAVERGCRVVVCVSELNAGLVWARFDGIGAGIEHVVLAYTGVDAMDPAAAERLAKAAMLIWIDTTPPRLILGVNVERITKTQAASLAAIDGVSGLLVLTDDGSNEGTFGLTSFLGTAR